jgi:hypothetical protein
MSDPLRDRIARISRCQGHHHPDQPHVAECQAEPDEWDHELADAVIAELKRYECGNDLCECSQCRERTPE